MYVLIDLETLRFIAKHSNPIVLCSLFWLEFKDADFCVFPVDKNALKYFTDIDLRRLYENYFGKPCSYSNRAHLRAILVSACENITADEIEPWELEMQCRAATDKSRYYAYKKGSFLLNIVENPSTRVKTGVTLNEADIVANANLKLFG